jgi:hypothetical protein
MPRILGVYDLPGKTAAAITQIRARGYTDIITYAPAPFEEVDDAVDPKPSAVRVFTLIGGLAGVITGYAVTVWMANNWQVVIGGKPFSSIPPYTIIAFELTILFGGVLTVIGLFVVGKLPRFKLDAAYSARFSGDEFGLVVKCEARDVPEIDALLRENKATEVNLVEA